MPLILLVLVSLLSQQLGASVAGLLFDDVGSAGMVALRIVFSAAVLLAVTGVIVVALAVFAYRFTRTAALPVVLALAALLGGALANLIDRAADGLVTDYPPLWTQEVPYGRAQ